MAQPITKEPIHVADAADVMQLLKLTRKARGWSQLELARITGLKQSNISAYETRRKTPSLQTLFKLTDGLDLDLWAHRD